MQPAFMEAGRSALYRVLLLQRYVKTSAYLVWSFGARALPIHSFGQRSLLLRASRLHRARMAIASCTTGIHTVRNENVFDIEAPALRRFPFARLAASLRPTAAA